MASNYLEEPNMETEEETLALRKKRARRVSFADVEITSVHVFNRDDDFETQSNPQAIPVAAADDEVVGFFRDLADSDEYRESPPNLAEYGEDVNQRKSFLRSVGTPSPGSSTVGSATSNDEDNFFGPVSASFIRPGRLSNSAATDDNPDITMDSTAFSMHFRSLARSDGGDLKTPTTVIAFEEKTPIQIINLDSYENFMALTKAKKPNFQPLNPVVVSGGKDSNDMSIVGENPYKFDYARLSPALNALLTEGSKDLHSISAIEKSLDKSEALITHNPKGHDIVSGNTELENGSAISMKGTTKASKHNMDVNANMDINASNHKTSQDVNHKPLISAVTSRNDLSNGRYENSPEIMNEDSDPMQRFILSPSAGKDNSLGTPNSIRHSEIVTPISKHKSFGINKDIITFREGMLSTQKSISKFKIPQRSPCPSSVKDGNEKLRSRLSSYSSMQNLTTVTLANGKDVQCKAVVVPIAHLEEELFASDTINSGHESVVGIDRKGDQTPKLVGRSRDAEAGDLLQVGDLSIDIFSEEKLATLQDPAVSLFQDIESRKQKLMQQSMNYQNEKRFATPLANTLLTSSKNSNSKYEISKNLYDKLILSPVKNLDKIFSPSAKYQDSLSQESRIWDKNTPAYFTTLQNEAPENPFGTNSTPSIEPSCFKNLGQMENGGGSYLSYQSKYEHVENFQKEMDVWDSHFTSADKDLKVGIVQRQWPQSQRNIKSSPQQSVSAVKNIRTPFNKKAVENFKRNPTENSTSKEMTQTLSQNDNLESIAIKGTVSPNLTGKNHGNSQSMLSQVIENLSARKRNSSNLVPLNRDCHDVETVMQRSTKVHKIGRNDLASVQEQSNQINNSLKKIGDATTLKQLRDISYKFLVDARDLLPSLINELNTQVIDRLEDSLVQLSNARKYEILSHEIWSQKIDELTNLRHKRTADLSLLAWKIAYEKAKVHLLCLKRDRHLAKGQLLSLQIHDFQTLNLKYNHFSQFQLKVAQVENCSKQSRLINVGNREVSFNRKNTSTQEFERLNQEIHRLRKYFLTQYKLERESSSADIIELVREHLKQRQLCKFVSQLLQSWSFASFGRKDGCFDFVLNYLDYVTQSFMIRTVPVSSIVISYKLNTTGITKIFPNMNAQSAFDFVINVGGVKKCVASRYISLETQQLGSLMHTLLDVIEELQLAQTEITNLIQISFHSPSDKQLDLKLCFIDFSSGEKITMILDVTNLNRGIYPSEVLPHKIEAPPQSKYTLSDTFMSNMRREVESLSVGYSRILRLCRCVSEVMQTLSR